MENEKKGWLVGISITIVSLIVFVIHIIMWSTKVLGGNSDDNYRNYIVLICVTVLAVVGMICCVILASLLIKSNKQEKASVSEKMLDLFEKVYLKSGKTKKVKATVKDQSNTKIYEIDFEEL